MRNDQYYSIGQASRLCNISIQTLRYYDKIGLVKPAQVDPSSSYRYYSNLDLLHIKIIQDMKSFHFSLEEIKELLVKKGVSGLICVMENKKQELLEEARRLEVAAQSVERRIQQLTEISELSSGLRDLEVLIELKWLEDRRVAYDRKHGACGLEPSVIRFTELFQKIEESQLSSTGYILSIYHEDILTFDRQWVDLELCIPVQGYDSGLPFIRTLPEGDYITALYSGIPNEESCKAVYRKVFDWMDKHGYSKCGPSIEQYIVDLSRMMDPKEYIVEMQIPVKKRLTL